ncbi:MAG TPA: lipase family protein, partial [Mycobacteriales bacterium]|nr:lipase family protein [Mycobacteriales bacterium]
SADSFYVPPASLAGYADGAVIRERSVQLTLAGGLPLTGASAYQLLYRTNDGHGRAVANVTTVIVPDGAKPSGARSIVSLQDAEDSLTSNCAPSYQLQVGEGDNSDLLLEFAATEPALVSTGHVLVVPDVEGPRSEMWVRTAEAHAVLDSVRAVEHFRRAQVDGRHTRVALVGYSGGGNETLAAAELQRSYAPDIRVVAVAAGGSFVNDRAADHYIDANASGAVMGALLGLQRVEPRLGWTKLLNTHGSAVRRAETDGSGCVSPVVSEYEHIDSWTTIPHPLAVARIARAISRNALGRHAPTAPTMLYISAHDQLISPSGQQQLAAYYCAHGTQLDFVRDPLLYLGDDHIVAALGGFIPRALTYVDDGLSGHALPDTCAS